MQYIRFIFSHQPDIIASIPKVETTHTTSNITRRHIPREGNATEKTGATGLGM